MLTYLALVRIRRKSNPTRLDEIEIPKKYGKVSNEEQPIDS
jgi:hypothetical protein